MASELTVLGEDWVLWLDAMADELDSGHSAADYYASITGTDPTTAEQIEADPNFSTNASNESWFDPWAYFTAGAPGAAALAAELGAGVGNVVGTAVGSAVGSSLGTTASSFSGGLVQGLSTGGAGTSPGAATSGFLGIALLAVAGLVAWRLA